MARDFPSDRSGGDAARSDRGTLPAPDSGTRDSGTPGGHRTDDRFVAYRRTGNRRLRDELVEDHIGLAIALAQRYRDRGVAGDDLRQVAALGLIKAVDRFDPGRGVAFSSYAVPTILGELRRYFRDHAWGMQVPRRLKRLSQRTSTVTDQLRQDLGRAPTVDEVAEALGESRAEVLAAREALRAYRPDSIEQDRAVRPVAELLADATDAIGAVDAAHQIDHMLDQLPARERRILVLRFRDELTQAEIADMVGISQMHVSRLLRRSLQQLRDGVVVEGLPERGGRRPVASGRPAAG